MIETTYNEFLEETGIYGFLTLANDIELLSKIKGALKKGTFSFEEISVKKEKYKTILESGDSKKPSRIQDTLIVKKCHKEVNAYACPRADPVVGHGNIARPTP